MNPYQVEWVLFAMDMAKMDGPLLVVNALALPVPPKMIQASRNSKLALGKKNQRDIVLRLDGSWD